MTQTRTVTVEVLLSSGTSQQTLDYVIHNVETFSRYEHYYYINTEDKEYYFPIDRTIIRADRIK